MSGSVNRVILIGRAGKDAQTRTFPDGGKIVSFSIATSKKWRDRNSGERREEATWHNIVAQDKFLAEFAEQNVRKGQHVYIEGEIRNRSWEKDGTKHYITEIVIPAYTGKLELLSAPPQAAPREERQPDRTDQKGNPKWEGGDDEIPF